MFTVVLTLYLLDTLSLVAGHGAYRLMGITCKIYDVRRQYGGITEPGARSALLSHAHRCNTSLNTMLVSAMDDTPMSASNLVIVYWHWYASCLFAVH